MKSFFSIQSAAEPKPRPKEVEAKRDLKSSRKVSIDIIKDLLAKNHQDELIRLFQAGSININEGTERETFFGITVKNNMFKFVSTICEKYKNLNDLLGESQFVFVVNHYVDNSTMLHLLIQHGADINWLKCDAFQRIATNGTLDDVIIFIEKCNVDVNKKEHEGNETFVTTLIKNLIYKNPLENGLLDKVRFLAWHATDESIRRIERYFSQRDYEGLGLVRNYDHFMKAINEGRALARQGLPSPKQADSSRLRYSVTMQLEEVLSRSDMSVVLRTVEFLKTQRVDLSSVGKFQFQPETDFENQVLNSLRNIMKPADEKSPKPKTALATFSAIGTQSASVLESVDAAEPVELRPDG